MKLKLSHSYRAVIISVENGINNNPTDSMLLIDFKVFMSYVLEACVLIDEGYYKYDDIVKKITDKIVESSYTFTLLQNFNFQIETLAQTYLEEGIESLLDILKVTNYRFILERNPKVADLVLGQVVIIYDDE